MFCKMCGHEVPEESLFCPHCGTKLLNEKNNADSEPVNQEGNAVVNSSENTQTDYSANNVQNTAYTQESWHEPQEQSDVNMYESIQDKQVAGINKKNKKLKSIKIISIAAVIVIAVAGITYLIYNSQPFFSRLFKGEEKHFTDIIENAGDSIQGIGGQLENVQAKMTNKIEYDFSSLAALASALGEELPQELADVDASLTSIIEIDGKNNASRITANLGINGSLSPDFSIASANKDIGIYIEGLTKEYLSLGFILDEYQKEMNTQLSYGGNVGNTENADITLIIEKLEALKPVLDNYRDIIIETIFEDEDNVEYESGNDDLGFKAYCYKITIEADDIVNVLEAVLKKAENDDSLMNALADLMAAAGDESIAESFKAEYKDSISAAIEEFDNSAKKEMRDDIESVIKEIEFTLWFDGQNNPLAAEISVDITNQGKISFEIQAYKRSGETVGLLQLKAAGQSIFKISFKSEKSRGKTNGDLTVQMMGERIVKCSFDLKSFDVRGITLYDGSISFELNTEPFNIPVSDIKLSVKMNKKDNGMNTNLKLSMGINSDYTDMQLPDGELEIGTLKIDTTVEALDENISDVKFTKVDADNIESYIDTEGFKAIMQNWISVLN